MSIEKSIRDNYVRLGGELLVDENDPDWFVQEQFRKELKMSDSTASDWIKRQLKTGNLEAGMKIHDGKRRKCYRFVEQPAKPKKRQ